MPWAKKRKRKPTASESRRPEPLSKPVRCTTTDSYQLSEHDSTRERVVTLTNESNDLSEHSSTALDEPPRKKATTGQILTREALEELQRSLEPLTRNEETHTSSYHEASFTSDSEGIYSDPREAFNHKYGCLPPVDEYTSHIIASLVFIDPRDEFNHRYGYLPPSTSASYTSGHEELYIDPREEYNHKYGYLPPVDEFTSRVIASAIKHPTSSLTWATDRVYSEDRFRRGLDSRNVRKSPSRSIDACSEQIKSFDPEEFLRETVEEKIVLDDLWFGDRAMLSWGSNSALFQIKMMFNLIDRHLPIFEKLLMYSTNEPWTCLPMPSHERFLTQPKPDLAVCFNRESFISENLWKVLPMATRDLACFENRMSGESKVFHFLAIEAKNAPLEDRRAMLESLNTASQALHNVYEFFNDAGPSHKRIFFDKIRFFSVFANYQGIRVCIHRAVEIPDNALRYELVLFNRPEYRLSFEYREWVKLTESEFTREKVRKIFRRIYKYAIDELRVSISAAAEDLAKKMDPEAQSARGKLDFYRHGEPSPES
jgi:hypothetical protein